MDGHATRTSVCLVYFDLQSPADMAMAAAPQPQD